MRAINNKTKRRPTNPRHYARDDLLVIFSKQLRKEPNPAKDKSPADTDKTKITEGRF